MAAANLRRGQRNRGHRDETEFGANFQGSVLDRVGRRVEFPYRNIVNADCVIDFGVHRNFDRDEPRARVLSLRENSGPTLATQ